MTKYNIEEGEVLEKRPRKKKLFLATIGFILVGTVFFLIIRYDLINEFKEEQLKKKSLNNPDKNISHVNSNRDWSDDLAQLNQLVERLGIDSQNFEVKLRDLTDKLTQTNAVLKNEPNKLINKQTNIRTNRVLQTVLDKFNKQLKDGRNLKAIQSNLDELILVLSLYSEDIDNSIFSQIEEIKTNIDKQLDNLINQVDVELVALNNELWGAITSNPESESLLPINGTEKVAEKPINAQIDESSISLGSRFKKEILKFIDIEPLNSGVMPHISDINRLKATTELSVKIAVARTLLLDLEFIKLNSYLSTIKTNFEFYFPEMEDSQNSINSIFEKINNLDFQAEELEKILRLLKINIEEQ